MPRRKHFCAAWWRRWIPHGKTSLWFTWHVSGGIYVYVYWIYIYVIIESYAWYVVYLMVIETWFWSRNGNSSMPGQLHRPDPQIQGESNTIQLHSQKTDYYRHQGVCPAVPPPPNPTRLHWTSPSLLKMCLTNSLTRMMSTTQPNWQRCSQCLMVSQVHQPRTRTRKWNKTSWALCLGPQPLHVLTQLESLETIATSNIVQL